MLTVAETTTNKVMGVATFEARMWLCTSVIALIAAQSSFLLSVRPSLWISALVIHCWSFFKGGRNVVAVGLLRTASANSFDQVQEELTPEWTHCLVNIA